MSSVFLTQNLEDYLREQEAVRAAVKEGMDAADKGEFATDAEVEAVFNKYAPS